MAHGLRAPPAMSHMPYEPVVRPASYRLPEHVTRRAIFVRAGLALGGLALASAVPAWAQSSTVEAGSPQSLGGRVPFPNSNAWNTDTSGLPVDPNSANLLASIGLKTGLHPDFGTV